MAAYGCSSTTWGSRERQPGLKLLLACPQVVQSRRQHLRVTAIFCQSDDLCNLSLGLGKLPLCGPYRPGSIPRKALTLGAVCVDGRGYQVGSKQMLPPGGEHAPLNFHHSCGYYLADSTIQDYLGHRDPAMTVRYNRVAGVKFEGLWR